MLLPALPQPAQCLCLMLQPAHSSERQLGLGAASLCCVGHPVSQPAPEEQCSPAILGGRALTRGKCSGGRWKGLRDLKGSPFPPHQPWIGKQTVVDAFSPYSLAWDVFPHIISKQVQPSPFPQAAWADQQAAGAVLSEQCIPVQGAFLPSPTSSHRDGASRDGPASYCTQSAAWLGQAARQEQGLQSAMPWPSRAGSTHLLPAPLRAQSTTKHQRARRRSETP